MVKTIDKKMKVATKWSVATEIAGKILAPVSNMILARLLTPEAFGVVATVTMITSFADMFTDAGFQKYLVQHEFKNREEFVKSTNVAFWTNLMISLLLWVVIIVFRNNLATLVGNRGLGNVIAIACISLPLTSFSSIQMALFKRDFDYKTLFMVRMVTIFIPIGVTVPLALVLRSYWALIFGTILINVVNAVLLTVKSAWKPYFFYSIKYLKEMISFSMWTLIEQISIWLTSYIGTFIVGSVLTAYYVGLYKTSIMTVNQITTLITGATTSILFSALSRVQNDKMEFSRIFFGFQKSVAIFAIPLGIGIWLYQDLITKILLGNQWTEAAGFIGLWGLMSSITIVFSHFSSEVYRAKGKPKLSFFVQCTHLIVLIPALTISAQYGFETLYVVRSLIRIEMIAVNMIIMTKYFSITPVQQLTNCLPSIICSIIMSVAAVVMQMLDLNTVGQFISVLVCIVVYFASMMIFPNERAIIKSYLSRILKHKIL